MLFNFQKLVTTLLSMTRTDVLINSNLFCL